MKKEKARKHLINARESLEFWREQYLNNERDTNPMIDIYLSSFRKSIREERRESCIKCIKEAKERISKFERIVY